VSYVNYKVHQKQLDGWWTHDGWLWIPDWLGVSVFIWDCWCTCYQINWSNTLEDPLQSQVTTFRFKGTWADSVICWTTHVLKTCLYHRPPALLVELGSAFMLKEDHTSGLDSVIQSLSWAHEIQIRCCTIPLSILQCYHFERFQQIRNLTNVLSALLSNVNLWKNPQSTTDFIRYAQTFRECRQTFCSQIQPITQTTVLNVQHIFCSVMCYMVLIWTLLLLTIGNNIVTLFIKLT